jgi:mono/diheme cytochrome c family protein
MLCLSGCGSKSEQAQPTSFTPQLPGQRIFLSHCVACHQGTGNPPGPNATILDSDTLQTEQTFRELVRHPRSSMMRTFSEEELSNADVHELYAYLQAVKTPQPH